MLVELIRENAESFGPLPTGLTPEVEPLENIHAVVFDVYGTLIASGVGDISLAEDQRWDAAIEEAIEGVGFRFDPTVNDWSERFRATVRARQEERKTEGIAYPEVEIRDVWERLIEDLCEQELLDGELTRQRLEALSVRFEMAVNPVWPMPGAPETIASITRRALPLGIVSNAQFFTPLLFEAFFEKDLEALGFDPVCCVWSYLKREAKPSRALFREAAEKFRGRYRIEPEQILYVGNDIRNDIWPAHEEGFRTALFAGDRRSLRLREDDPDCAHVKPDRVLTELSQIPEKLFA